MDTNKQQPLLSVRLMTYNHAPFIREAMEGIMMQKTNFLIEVVVGDDFSTDGTIDIIREYKNKKNIEVKILERKIGGKYWKARQEKGRVYNFINIIENCNGKYIALIDGDDYWTDPLKLQKQVDFLEGNEEFVMSFHDTTAVDESSKIINRSNMKEFHKKNHSPIELILGAGMPTSSNVIRTEALKKAIVSDFVKIFNADTFLYAQLANYGSAYYHKEMLSSAYRFHPGGMWSSKTILYRRTQSLITRLYLYCNLENKEWKDLLRKKRIYGLYFKLIKIHLLNFKFFKVFLLALSFILFLVDLKCKKRYFIKLIK